MKSEFTRGALQAQLMDTERLLVLVGNHPLMSISMQHRVNELKHRIEKIPVDTEEAETNLPLKARWAQLIREYSEEQQIEKDAQMLIFQFLSEIQKHMEAQGLDRKMLAEKIEFSAARLTQIWRGNKPLSFTTLVKMQRALGIRFEIKGETGTQEIFVQK